MNTDRLYLNYQGLIKKTEMCLVIMALRGASGEQLMGAAVLGCAVGTSWSLSVSHLFQLLKEFAYFSHDAQPAKRDVKQLLPGL